jgi:hypothetical protein
MDLSAVSHAAAKDVAAVEFGGGAIWELDCCQVEVNRGGDADGEQVSRADGWKVAASRKTKRWERKKEENSIRVEVNERFIGVVTKEEQSMTMTFQVAGVKKALAAVSKICKAGNIVQFGDEAADCFIMNKASKKKVMLLRKRGSYILNVEFVRKVIGPNGEERFETMGKELITIDSGAEESVCPLGWGESFGINPVRPGMELRMINAGGGVMPHFGSRKVQFASTGF